MCPIQVSAIQRDSFKLAGGRLTGFRGITLREDVAAADQHDEPLHVRLGDRESRLDPGMAHD